MGILVKKLIPYSTLVAFLFCSIIFAQENFTLNNFDQEILNHGLTQEARLKSHSALTNLNLVESLEKKYEQ